VPYKSKFRNSIVATCVTILMFAASTASAKCKFFVDMPNIMTGEHVRWTKWTTTTMVMGNPYTVATGISEGDRKYLGLRIHKTYTLPRIASKEDLDNAIVVPAGSDVFFQMADESIIKIKTDQPVTGNADFVVHNAKRYDMAADAIVKVPLTAEDLSALTAQRVLRIRVMATTGDLDFKFGKKGSKKIGEVLTCIQ
jgi:hypothetical protein